MRTNDRLLKAWTDEREAAGAARRNGDLPAEWRHLERAHILSGLRRHDRREVAGRDASEGAVR